ncbi:MAG: MarR family winged helix-turn-helix transcriptional regulator [Phycisphaerae bacterium]
MVFSHKKRKISTTNNRLPILIPEAELPRENSLAIARVYSLMTKQLHRSLREIHLTISQFEVLMILRVKEGLSQRELAECLLVTKGNVCTVLGRMEKNKWLIRRPDSQDGRAHCLYLMPEGRRMVAKAATLAAIQERLLMDGLSIAEQRSLHGLLDRLEKSPGAL